MGGVPQVCVYLVPFTQFFHKLTGVKQRRHFPRCFSQYNIYVIINNVTSLARSSVASFNAYVERAAHKLIDVSVVTCKLQRTRRLLYKWRVCVLRLTFPSIEIEPKIILRRIPSLLENPLRLGLDEYRMLYVIFECNTLACVVWCGDWMRLRCGRFSTKSIWKHFRHNENTFHVWAVSPFNAFDQISQETNYYVGRWRRQ